MIKIILCTNLIVINKSMCILAKLSIVDYWLLKQIADT